MTNADWWARVVQARTERDDLLPQRVWTLHKGEHAAAIDLQGGARHRRRDRAHGGRGAAQDAAVPITRAGGTGRRDRGHAGDVRGEGVGVNAKTEESGTAHGLASGRCSRRGPATLSISSVGRNDGRADLKERTQFGRLLLIWPATARISCAAQPRFSRVSEPRAWTTYIRGEPRVPRTHRLCTNLFRWRLRASIRPSAALTSFLYCSASEGE